MNRIRSSVFLLVLLAFFSTNAFAQTREITGRVTSTASGQPLPDAVVAVLGQTSGVRTNERGEFRLKVPDGDVTIVARAIGYKRAAQRISAGSSEAAPFALEKDVLELEGADHGLARTDQAQQVGAAVAGFV